jgi:ectoine hydroxylase-related dioxygenase (phytanoyl-CoA dioxygenase family)
MSESFEAAELGASARAAFERDGIVCVRNLVDRQWIELLRHSVDDALAHPGPTQNTPSPGYTIENTLWRRRAGFRTFALEGPIAQAAALLMGSQKTRMFNDTMFVKEPATFALTQWHQDLPYFKLGGKQNCSVWIPLDPVTQASGAVTYAAGSHAWGKMFQPVSFGENGGKSLNDLGFDGPVPDVDADPGRYPTLSFDMQPGDVTFHNLMTMHKAGENTTKETRRRVHTIRMAGDDATYLERPFATTEFETTLQSGDPLSGPLFPVLWPRPVRAANGEYVGLEIAPLVSL